MKRIAQMKKLTTFTLRPEHFEPCAILDSVPVAMELWRCTGQTTGFFKGFHRESKFRAFALALFSLLAPLTATSTAASLEQGVSVTSPSGQVVSAVSINDKKQLSHAVQYCGKPFLGSAPLGITADGVDLGAGVEWVGAGKTENVAKTLTSRGVSSQVKVNYRQSRFTLRHVASKVEYAVDLRVYDDGVAFRYLVPGTGTRKINGEATSYQLPAQALIWSTTPHNSYEGNYQQLKTEDLKPQQLMMPVVFNTADTQAFGAITEGFLVNYGGQRLNHEAAGRLNAVFNDEKEFSLEGAIQSPWRVVMMARNLDGLVNNAILRELAPAPAPELQKAAWIVPSRLGWSWMAGGGLDGVNLDNMKRYARACADLGFEGNLVDEGWSHWDGGGEKAWAQVKELVDYSNELGVKTWLWKACPDRRGIPGLYDPAVREEFFRRCSELGVVGVKLDFIESERLASVNFMRDTLELAARYKLMVIFHGCNKPTGVEYTWPHEMSREGIRGLEHGQNPSLDQRHPFGRLLAGHGDYSPFWCQGGATRAHYLGTLITYTSGALLPCEHPENIRDMPEAEFFKSIPLTWDETRVLPPSEFGQCAAFARRRSGSWFLALTNDKAARKVEMPLGFLGAGPWLTEIHADIPDKPDASTCEQRLVQSTDVLPFDMTSFGGGTARFSKIGLSRYGGRVKSAEKIKILTADPKSDVRYTLDGSSPTRSSPRCPADGIPINKTCRLGVKIVAGDGSGAELSYSYAVSAEK